MARALITGIAGQDGSYLAELLLGKGYEVHGLAWPPMPIERTWLAPLKDRLGVSLFLREGDMQEPGLLARFLQEIHPEEIYHLAGQTHVVASFEDPEAALELNARAVVRLIETARRMEPSPRIFHASSAEVFGSPEQCPQDESTPMRPLNPYGCAKAFASQMLHVYRQAYGLFATNGFLYPHESPRRGEHFVTRKVCLAAAAIKLGRQKELLLGDMTAQRDWGDARDYVRGMWLSLQHATPEDFVFATGRLHSVQDLVRIAFEEVGLDWRQFTRTDQSFVRPVDPRRMVGNAAKAERLLGWRPETQFRDLIREMVRLELDRLRA